jgi:hypothetical protein
MSRGITLDLNVNYFVLSDLVTAKQIRVGWELNMSMKFTAGKNVFSGNYTPQFLSRRIVIIFSFIIIHYSYLEK